MVCGNNVETKLLFMYNGVAMEGSVSVRGQSVSMCVCMCRGSTITHECCHC